LAFVPTGLEASWHRGGTPSGHRTTQEKTSLDATVLPGRWSSVIKVSVFMQRLVEPGERWEKELYKRIDECDLFVLFWSNAAKRSKWVRKEIEYAHRRKRGKDHSSPRIFPVILGTHHHPNPLLNWLICT
jgi:hypothetical protein